jgi:hypothetical protein
VRTATLCALALSLSLALVVGGARAASEYDFNDYTLDAPPAKGAKFTVRQAVSLTEKWDKHGVVRLAVISDHNLGYELWSGVELINIANEKLYNVNAVKCFVSFCVYVGKVPPGKYFINRLYADSFAPTSITGPIRKTSAPIRNTLGSFDVRVHSLTDLGMVGIFREVEASEDQSFQTSFLGYFDELALLYDETYRGFQKKYFGLTGPELRWDADWEKEALLKAQAPRRFFADFSRRQSLEGRHLFPTTMGSIYSLDRERGLTRGEVRTLFMLTALFMSADRWVAGAEAGRLFASADRGASWTAGDAFPRDEIVAHLFERDGVLHALTVSQTQAVAKLYRASTGMTFTEITRTRFALEGKVNKPRILVDFAGARESLTQTFINRVDLKKVRVLESRDVLTVQLNSRQFVSFSFASNNWTAFRAERPVPWVTANGAGITLMSSRENGTTIIEHLGTGLGAQRNRLELRAVPRGGLHVREDGARIAILSFIGDASAPENPPPAQIYALADGAPPTPVRSLADVGFFHDSELHAMDDALLLIDRVAPRVHGFAGARVTTYSLYDR